MHHESVIRDDLATKLSLLEPGLELINTEYHLPNPHGTRGFVDILARDRFGSRVIIELKRTNQASREALHEVCKYLALFCLNTGINRQKIRCFVVSLEWSELMVPFSEFARSSACQVEGFKLILDESGLIEKAEKIVPTSLPPPMAMFREHGIFLYLEQQKRDNGLREVEKVLHDAGASGYLLFCLEYEGPSRAVIYRHGVYLIATEIPDHILSQIRMELMNEYTREETELEDSLVEGAFLEKCIEALRNHDSFEIGYPEKYLQMTSGGWRCSKLVRKGKLASEAVYSNDDLARMVSRVEAGNYRHFVKQTSPKLKIDWGNIAADAHDCLKGNGPWMEGLRIFCRRIELECREASVSINVFNPMSLLKSLYKRYVDNDERYIPNLELIAFDQVSNKLWVMAGTLGWDGRTFPKSIEKSLAGISHDLFDFLLLEHQGLAWRYDLKLLENHGLEYVLLFGVFSFGNPAEFRLVEEERVANQVPDGLQGFLENNKEYLAELTSHMKSMMGFIG